jgi:hypothetical protein
MVKWQQRLYFNNLLRNDLWQWLQQTFIFVIESTFMCFRHPVLLTENKLAFANAYGLVN